MTCPCGINHILPHSLCNFECDWTPRQDWRRFEKMSFIPSLV